MPLREQCVKSVLRLVKLAVPIEEGHQEGSLRLVGLKLFEYSYISFCCLHNLIQMQINSIRKVYVTICPRDSRPSQPS